jgi:prepilin-type N-terminal cleavage/methylation domain-containing protein
MSQGAGESFRRREKGESDMGEASARDFDHQRPRRGLTLIESVIATAVLAVAITAVYGALAAGTVQAAQSAEDLAATVAVEDLLNRILADDPDRLDDWDGYSETLGNLVDADGTPLAGGVGRVGRRATVERLDRELEGGPRIRGWNIRVEAIDGSGRSLGGIERWIPDGSEVEA